LRKTSYGEGRGAYTSLLPRGEVLWRQNSGSPHIREKGGKLRKKKFFAPQVWTGRKIILREGAHCDQKRETKEGILKAAWRRGRHLPGVFRKQKEEPGKSSCDEDGQI